MRNSDVEPMTVYPEAVNDYMAINPLAFPMSEQPIVSRIKQIDWLNIVAQVPKRSSCKQLSIARPASPMQQRMDMGTPALQGRRPPLSAYCSIAFSAAVGLLKPAAPRFERRSPDGAPVPAPAPRSPF